MDETFKINLNIVGSQYTLSIKRSDEEKYRRAEREVNSLVAMYKNRFRAQDSDYLAMAALQVAVLKIDAEMSRNIGDDLDVLTDIERSLDASIEKF